ncbi:MAG: hypothetical protein KJN87_06520 [Desulfofustis sp.]|nr:hypothetical protein [Desulfofustis sp.]
MIAAKFYRYSIDRLNGRFISGWCYPRFSKSRPVYIAAMVDGTLIGRFTNDRYRPDLVEQQLHPSGVCGFDFSFPADFTPDSCQWFELYFDSFKTPVTRIGCSEIELLKPSLTAPICFMHIPKTAGTSFNALARSCFSGDRFITHIERLGEQELQRGLERVHYLAGHLPLHELEKVVDLSGFELISIIREPYSHLHSHLNYVKGVRPGSKLESYYGFHHNETIKSLSDALNRIDFSNPEEIHGFVTGLHDYQLDFFDNIQTRYFLDYRPDRVGEEELRRACSNTSRFISVGLTETYECFKDSFCELIGVSSAEQKLQSNKSDYYQLFDLADQHIREVLAPLVQFDLYLYDYVSTQFWPELK